MRHRSIWRYILLAAVAFISMALLPGCPPPAGEPPDDSGDGGDGNPTWPVIMVYFATNYDTQLSVNPGSITDLGTVLEGAERELTFVVKNQGSESLYLTGTPCIAFSGADAALFSLVKDPATTIPMLENSTFRIRITPGAAGDIEAVVSIDNNDPDHGSFTFTICAAVMAPPAAVPATGQTTSYTTGDDGNLKAGVAWPTPRFTDNGDGTTTDHLTGLMWASAAGSSVIDWEGALIVANNSAFAGYEDWRLPNVNELMSLVNLGQTAPNGWLNGLDEFSGIQSGRYWTSTVIYQPTTLWAWVVNMDTGVLSRTNISVIPSSYPWKVRDAGLGTVALPRTGKTDLYRTGDDGDIEAGVAWPSPRFVDNGEGMVLHLLTGLIWQQSPAASSMSWEEAFSHAAGLNTGGYTDWRVPNRSELRSLSNYTYYDWNAYLSSSFGASIPSGAYWSSSTYAPATSKAWVVVIESGHAQYADKSGTAWVWAVRAGAP